MFEMQAVELNFESGMVFLLNPMVKQDKVANFYVF